MVQQLHLVHTCTKQQKYESRPTVCYALQADPDYGISFVRSLTDPLGARLCPQNTTRIPTVLSLARLKVYKQI
jgi:hypothetical protein